LGAKMNWQQLLKPKDALLVVDMQNDFCEAGALAVPDAAAIIPEINQALRAASEKGLVCLASRDWHPAEHCSFVAAGGSWPAHCVQGSYGAQFHPSLVLQDDMVVVNKGFIAGEEQYSAVYGQLQHNPNLTMLQYLNDHSVQRVWVVGLALDYCVRATALELAQEGFTTLVALSATRAIDTAASAALLDELSDAGIIVVKA
jgi:nicotinamidase/pyrazinamidase